MLTKADLYEYANVSQYNVPLIISDMLNTTIIKKYSIRL